MTAAKESDLIIFCGGLSATVSREGLDRPSLIVSHTSSLLLEIPAHVLTLGAKLPVERDRVSLCVTMTTCNLRTIPLRVGKSEKTLWDTEFVLEKFVLASRRK